MEEVLLEFETMLGDSISSIEFNTTSKMWWIHYKNTTWKPDYVHSDDLVEFLQNDQP